MSDPTRYRVANNQAQLTLGGGILAVDPAGPLVMYDDYAELRMERIHDLNQIGGLQEENARLKADVNELADGLKLASEVGIKIADEVTRLKAEVERLKIDAYKKLSMRIEIDKLKARIEYLTNAGDFMADAINGDYNYELPCVQRWNAAKEGKV